MNCCKLFKQINIIFTNIAHHMGKPSYGSTANGQMRWIVQQKTR